MTSMPRERIDLTCRTAGCAAVALAVALPMPAHADVTVSPFADIRQVISDNTSDGRSARGWLELGAGVNADFDTNRLDGSFSYRYARRIEEFGNLSRRNRHNANANIRAELIDEFLFLDAGGSATQYATDPRGFSSIDNDVDSGNQSQIFSGFVQPSIAQRIGDLAYLNANYRLGAVSVDSPREDLSLPGSIGLDPSDGIGSLLTDSVSHSGGITVSSQPGTNTISWSLTGNATLEDTDQLNQKYRGYSAGGEIGIRVSRKLELLGSGGYEDIRNTQDRIQFDPVTGLPVVDADGNFVIDPVNPRQDAFAFDGIYWNVGFRFAPSRRTSIEIRGGERYGQLNVFADASFQARSGLTVRGNFSQSLSSFTRLLTQSFNGMVFNVQRVGGIDQFAIPFCIFGIDPLSPDGECLFGLTQSITPATFRSDRGTLIVSRDLDTWSWSASAFFDKRRYLNIEQLQSPLAPQLPPGLLGDDQSYGIRGRISLRIDQQQSIGFDTLLSRNSFALSPDRRDTQLVGGVNYSYQLSQRLSASATFYTSRRFSENRRDSGSVTASAGLRYRF